MTRQNSDFTSAIPLTQVVVVPDPVFIQATLVAAADDQSLVLQVWHCLFVYFSRDNGNFEIL